MKVSKTFVKWFLVLFLIILVANISALAFGVWNQWFGWAFLALLALLFFLIFRKHKVGFVKFLAYFVPILLILAVLYVNILPFGYTDVQVINVGHARDTSGRFYLEESDSLGPRQMVEGDYFRIVDGIVHAVYNPSVILNNATITATLKGDDVYFLEQPSIDFEWDYDWTAENILDYFEVEAPHTVYNQFLSEEVEKVNFNKPFAIYVEWTVSESRSLISGGMSLNQDLMHVTLEFFGETIQYKLPDYSIGKNFSALVGYNQEQVYLFVNEEFVDKKEFEGKFSNIKTIGKVYQSSEVRENFEVKDGCIYFDGKTRLVFPNSSDMFEVGPFAVYVEWVPEKAEDSQQLIGHWNWEIFQNEKDAQFWIGRVYEGGPAFSKRKEIKNHLENKNTLLAIYNPISDNNLESYIKIYLNGEISGKVNLKNNTIWRDYGRQDLSMGWSGPTWGPPERTPYFQGSICNIKFVYAELKPQKVNSIEFFSSDSEIIIPIFGEGGRLKEVELKVQR